LVFYQGIEQLRTKILYFLHPSSWRAPPPTGQTDSLHKAIKLIVSDRRIESAAPRAPTPC
jgi:hypothetical protein